MKNIWIWNHYATRMYMNRDGRHYNFAKYLTMKGFQVTVFSASSTHKFSNTILQDKELYSVKYSEGIRFIIVRTYQKAASKFGRIMNMYSFSVNARRVAENLSKFEELPDVILASSVHPFTLIESLRFAKKKAIPCICEIRDLWPESLVAYGFLKRKSVFASYLYRRERIIYEKADALIFTMEGAVNYISERGWSKRNSGEIDPNKIFYINNGVDITHFDKNIDEYKGFRSELFPENKTNFIYTGSIRTVNDLEVLIKPIATLIDEGAKIRLILVGEGDKRAMLEEKFAFYGDSIIFTGKYPKKYIPALLKQADVCVVCSRQVPLCKYGISQNKIFDYMAAGKPILSLVQSPFNPILQYGCGFVTESQASDDIIAGIRYFMEMTAKEKKRLEKKARVAAENFDFSLLTDKLIEVIKSV